jgi:peptidoglycan/xylan/chitin deacetylase (PgdA/CDA1 family)
MAFPPGHINPRKRQLALALERLGVHRALMRAQGRVLGPYVRCVNYHSVAPTQAQAFEQQLCWYREHFTPVGPKELSDLGEGHWPRGLPGILLSFDDGCRTHAEVVAPLLEKHGFIGWFFVPSHFPDVPDQEQSAYARANAISVLPLQGERLSLSWEQVRHLGRHHVVGAHTRDHVRLRAELGRAEIERQVLDSKRRLEEELRREVIAFAWVGGEEDAYSTDGRRAVAEAGFRYGFGTNNQVWRRGADPRQIERTNVEAWLPPEVLRFQLSGVLDLVYAAKRRRLRRVFAQAPD